MATEWPNIRREGNRIVVSDNFIPQGIRRFLAATHEITQSRGYQELIFDFSECISGFSSVMLPVCALATSLRKNSVETTLILPEESRFRRLFINTGWAHHIEPSEYPEPNRQRVSRHFPAVRYSTHEEQNAVINELLERLLEVIPNFNRSAFAAVEWALNEITDNVLNHSESPVGGFVQLTVFDPRSNKIEFTISDAGVGVPKTLRTTHSQIITDADVTCSPI